MEKWVTFGSTGIAFGASVCTFLNQDLFNLGVLVVVFMVAFTVSVVFGYLFCSIGDLILRR